MIQIIPNFHPAVVHFPIALTIVSFAAALASQLFKKRVFANQLATVSHYLLWLAAATALVAVAFGWLAYNSVNHDDAGHVAMKIHRAWAIGTALLLLVLALWDAKKHLLTTILPVYFVAILGFASASVVTTAWLGGEVVYRHGIGVLALPEPEKADDGHAHDASASAQKHSAVDEHAAMPQKAQDESKPQAPVPQKEQDESKPQAPVPQKEQDESKPHTHKHKN